MNNHWEFSHLPFEGDLADEKIVCQNCGWSWKVSDGGNDLYNCHRCGFDNTKFYSNTLNFEGGQKTGSSTDWGKVITTSLDTASKFIPQQQGGRLNDEAKQGIASKKEAQALKKRIKTECRAKPLIGKSKKAKWEECKNNVIKKFDSKFQQTQEERNTQNKLKLEQIEKQQKLNRRNNIIVVSIIGVVVLTLGFVIYKKKINK